MNIKRPKLNIQKTLSERMWDVIGYSFYIGMLILLIFIWNDLPDQVPAHYNAQGEVDRLGSKWELLILPTVSLFLLLFLQVLEKYPEWHNYPKKFTESNAKVFYLASRKLINQIKNLSLIVFALILYNTVAIALGWNEGFGSLFFVLMVISFFIPIINVLIQYRKIE